MSGWKPALLMALCAFALAGCAHTVEVNGDGMTVEQAQQTIQKRLPGQLAELAGQYSEDLRAISDVRLRPDGIGLLWIHGRPKSAFSWGMTFDNPKDIKICYFAQSAKPTILYRTGGATSVFGLCDLELVFIDKDEDARAIAEAIYVLEQNAK